MVGITSERECTMYWTESSEFNVLPILLWCVKVSIEQNVLHS